jgi:hypothetical protein
VDAGQSANASLPIVAPPASDGTWYDLGTYQAPWLAGGGHVPAAAPDVLTHVVGWRREAASDDPNSTNGNTADWLAIIIVQRAPGASTSCASQPSSLDVKERGPGCLRLRRNADFDGWMQAAQPTLYRWIDAHGWSSRPRAWVAYRLPAASDGAFEVHALITPSLIEPVTRNATDFIASGLPGQQWARQLAAAARAAAAAPGNALIVPPFPFAPGPHAEAEATLPDTLPTAPKDQASAPAVAEQVTPDVPAARASAPRRGRE